MPDPAVVRCPACSHLLYLPEDFLGKVVTCLECHATFRAPTRNGDGLTAPEVIRPGVRKVSPFVFMPMIGLLLLGAAGVIVNGYLYFTFKSDPDAARTFALWALRQQAKETPDEEKPNGPLSEADRERQEARRKAFADDQEKRIDETAAAAAPVIGPIQGPFALVSLGVLAGGIAFAARRCYWLAFVGCGLAALNVNHLCCVPGAVVGIWGIFALISNEGRRHFGRA
jgi:hypothetical protein